MKTNTQVYRQLMPKKESTELPALYTNQEVGEGEAKFMVKYFNPCGAQTWYISEGEPITDEDGAPQLCPKTLDQDWMFYGYVDGFDYPEWGYVTLGQLVDMRCSPFNMPIERDIHFSPTTLKEIFP